MGLRLMMPHFDGDLLDEMRINEREALSRYAEGVQANIKEWGKCLADGEKLYIAEVQSSTMIEDGVEITCRLDITHEPIYARNGVEASKYARERFGAEKFNLYEVNTEAYGSRME